MNIENMTILRDFIAKLPKNNFNHRYWEISTYRSNAEPVLVDDVNVCGTSACIGGWATVLGKLAPYKVVDNEIEFDLPEDWDWAGKPGEWLGLTEKEIGKIFYPWEVMDGSAGRDKYDEWIDPDTTNEQAAKFLTLCIENEKVRWKYWKLARS